MILPSTIVLVYSSRQPTASNVGSYSVLILANVKTASNVNAKGCIALDYLEGESVALYSRRDYISRTRAPTSTTRRQTTKINTQDPKATTKPAPAHRGDLTMAIMDERCRARYLIARADRCRNQTLRCATTTRTAAADASEQTQIAPPVPYSQCATI
jgi:hypothetical protein